MKLEKEEKEKGWDLTDEDVLIKEDLFTKKLLSAYYNIENEEYDNVIIDLQNSESFIDELKR